MWCEGLSQSEWDEKYDDNDEIIAYLHGRCNDWVQKNYQKGDKCLILTEYDEDVGKVCLLHCCLIRNEKYVDVRGETNSFDALLDDFDEGEYDVEEYDSLDEFSKRIQQIFNGLIEVGYYDPETGEIERGEYRQGYVFKDEDAFLNRPEDVCYVPESSDDTYTRNDILSLCKGNEKIAEEVFYNVDEQSPEMEIASLIEIKWIRYNEEKDTYEIIAEDE